MKKRILMVVTSHDRIDDDHPTGLWFEEFAVPYSEFRAKGNEVVVVSPRGGSAPVDPRSEPEAEQAGRWGEARQALQGTRHVEDVAARDFDAVFFPGGHGTMFDLPDNETIQRLITEFLDADKLVAAICHGPAALVNVKGLGGDPLVAGKTLTAFTDAEEREVQLADAMPFLLESRLRELGVNFVLAPNWADHVERDGNLITGQNPQSSGSAAQLVLEALGAETTPAAAGATSGAAGATTFQEVRHG